MSEVSKSGEGIVNYFKTNEALVPRSFRRSVKEVLRLVKSGLVCMAWACVTVSGYLAFNPSQIPVRFEREIGQVSSCQMETIEGVDRFVISLQQGEETTRFVELNGLWIDLADITNSADDELTEKFNEIKNSTQAAEALGVKADIDPNIKTFSLTPQFK